MDEKEDEEKEEKVTMIMTTQSQVGRKMRVERVDSETDEDKCNQNTLHEGLRVNKMLFKEAVVLKQTKEAYMGGFRWRERKEKIM